MLYIANHFLNITCFICLLAVHYKNSQTYNPPIEKHWFITRIQAKKHHMISLQKWKKRPVKEEIKN